MFYLVKSELKMSKKIQENTSTLRMLSATSRMSTTNRKLQNSFEDTIVSSFLLTLQINPSLLPFSCLFLLECLLVNCLRISELTGVKWCDKLQKSLFTCSGIKKSNSKIVYINEDKAFKLFAHYPTFDKLVIPVSYAYVYRLFKANNIRFQKDKKHLSCVTHLCRHFSIYLHSQAKGLEFAQSIAGHKSKNSTLWYLRKNYFENPTN